MSDTPSQRSEREASSQRAERNAAGQRAERDASRQRSERNTSRQRTERNASRRQTALRAVRSGRSAGAWLLFRGMLREEWRLHSTLFGGRRFAAFPLLIFALAAAGGWLLRLVGTPTASVIAGVHAMVFLFGMHVGTIGLVGHDSLQNLLGDVTLLLSASRTLPLSPRRLLAVFLLKDVAYYAAFFLAPVVAGLSLTGGVALAPVGGAAVVRAPQLLVTLGGTLGLGFAVVFAGIGLRTRGPAGTAVIGGVVAAVVAAGLAGVDPVAWTPYALVAPGARSSETWLATARALTPPLALALAGLAIYDPTYRKPARTRAAAFSTWRRRLRDGDGLVTKALFDVARSSGGLTKVPFSAGIVLAIAVGTVELVELLAGRPPAPGVTLGSLLGLTAFTTYNWLTQFDDPTSYLASPVGVADVLRAKYRAFLALGPPVGLAYYFGTVALYGAPLPDVVAGAALLLGLQGYLFGVTVYLTGLRPSELLFDTVLFAGFTAAVAVPLVPVLVAGMALSPLSDSGFASALAGAGVLLALVGVALARRATARWTRKYRLGEGV